MEDAEAENSSYLLDKAEQRIVTPTFQDHEIRHWLGETLTNGGGHNSCNFELSFTGGLLTEGNPERPGSTSATEAGEQGDVQRIYTQVLTGERK